MGWLYKHLCILCLLFPVSHVFASECIGVVTAGGGQGFWSEVKRGAIHAGKELGITIYARGAVDETDIKGQQNSINFVMKFGCIGLVLAPNTPSRKVIVSQLKNQGIPTVFVDRDIGGERVSVIQTNNFAAGELAGREMVKALKGTGRVAVLRLDKDVLTTTARENGFIKAAEHGGLVISIDKYLGTMIGEARSNAQEILGKISHVDGIFTPNESTSMAVIATVKQKTNKQTQQDMVHIGFDSSEYMVKALNAGRIHGFIVQRPFQMGYQGVHAVYNTVKETNIKGKIETGVVLVSRENISHKNIKEMLGLGK